MTEEEYDKEIKKMNYDFNKGIENDFKFVFWLMIFSACIISGVCFIGIAIKFFTEYNEFKDIYNDRYETYIGISIVFLTSLVFTITCRHFGPNRKD